MAIKRLTTPKRQFTYTVGEDSAVFTVSDLDTHSHMRPVYENWLDAQMDYEREWRNYELDACEYMLVIDATYAGKNLAGSQEYDDIIAYRAALRSYDLREEDRPSRPPWYLYK